MKQGRVRLTYGTIERLLRLPEGLRIVRIAEREDDAGCISIFIEGDGLPERCEVATGDPVPQVTVNLHATVE
jgi:hypothetical protein